MAPKLAAKTDTALVGCVEGRVTSGAWVVIADVWRITVVVVVTSTLYGSQRFPSQHFSSQLEKSPLLFINVHAVKTTEENNCTSHVLQ